MPCEHLHIKQIAAPKAEGCIDCLRTGDRWVHLRLCVECGNVGCCDSSPNRHARKHAHRAGHPVVQSFEPGEDWLYCFVDDEITEPEAVP